MTVGTNVGAAVARMWVLEASAETNRLAAAGASQVLNREEFSYWESVSEEILQRIWSCLKTKDSREQ